MSLTRIEAIDEIFALFKAAWDTTGYGDRVKYDNVASKSVPPEGTNPWARVVLRHGASSQATLANEAGRRRFRRTGVLTIQIFILPGIGLTGDADLPTIVRNAFEGVTSSGGIIFRDVAINEIGSDGDYFQTNVVAFFEYDEIK
jgi:hypothetical protein